MTETFKKWGYKDGEAKIFEVNAKDPKLPKGWVDSPAKIKQKKSSKKNVEGEGNKFDGMSMDDMKAIAEKAGIEIKEDVTEDELRVVLQKALDGEAK